MDCKEVLRTQSWLDGELDGDAAREAERHATTCAQCQVLISGTAAVGDALRGIARHRAPAHLRLRIGAALARERPRQRGFWAGVASGGGVTALAAGLALFILLPPSSATLAESVVAAHGRALMQGRTIMVASSDHHTVKPWLAAHVAISPPVRDFAAQGFALAGGRADEVAGRPAAVIVYRHGNHVIDLFAWPGGSAGLPPPAVVRGFRSAFWRRGDLNYAAISDTDTAAFTKFVALAEAQKE